MSNTFFQGGGEKILEGTSPPWLRAWRIFFTVAVPDAFLEEVDYGGPHRAVVPNLGVNYPQGVICDSLGGNAEPKPHCCSVSWAIIAKEIFDKKCKKILLRVIRHDRYLNLHNGSKKFGNHWHRVWYEHLSFVIKRQTQGTVITYLCVMFLNDFVVMRKCYRAYTQQRKTSNVQRRRYWSYKISSPVQLKYVKAGCRLFMLS